MHLTAVSVPAMNLIRTVIALGAAGVMTMGLAAPASAASDTVYDVRGDAAARLDVLKVNFHHTDRGARAVIHVRNLRDTGEFVFAVANRRNTVRFGLAATGREGPSTVKRFYKYRNGELSRKRCARAKVGWRPAKDIVTMSFPRRCFRALPRRIVLAVGSTRNFPTGRTVDEGPVAYLRR